MKNYLLYAFAALVIIFLAYSEFSNGVKKQPNGGRQVAQSADIAQNRLETKTDDQFAVAVTVTPIDISPLSEEWKFDIAMDTHSVELNQDLVESAVLLDDQGNEYRPIKWEGPVGGHHREGILSFSRITPQPKSIRLLLDGIGGDSGREFLWVLGD